MTIFRDIIIHVKHQPVNTKAEKIMIIPYLLAFFKYVIYGSSVFFTSSINENADVLDILALRFLMSLVVMWLLKTAKVIKMDLGVKEIFTKGRRSQFIPCLLLAALFEPVLYMFFETLGISMTTNITTAVILSLVPITCCIAEMIVLKENSTLLQKIFLAMGIIGVIYISVKTDTGDGKNSIWGILFLFLAIIVDPLFAVFSRKSTKAFSAMEITYASCMLGAVIFNAVNIVRHLINGTILDYFKPYFNLQNMIGFVFLGVISTILATGINNYCLSKMQVSTMSAFSGVSTLVTIIIGVFIGGEEMYYFHYIGLALIVTRMVGVAVIAMRRDANTVSIKPIEVPRSKDVAKK